MITFNAALLNGLFMLCSAEAYEIFSFFVFGICYDFSREDEEQLFLFFTMAAGLFFSISVFV